MTFKELKEEYLIDIQLEEETIDKRVIQLPKMMAKYQFFYSDTLQELASKNDIKDKLYYENVLAYKQGLGELGNYTLNGTELKKMLDCNIVFREINLEIANLELQLKTVEEFMSNIKSIGYSVNNYLTYKKIMCGMV